jgi:hypothetical protein
MKEQFTYNGHDYKRGDKIRIVSTLFNRVYGEDEDVGKVYSIIGWLEPNEGNEGQLIEVEKIEGSERRFITKYDEFEPFDESIELALCYNKFTRDQQEKLCKRYGKDIDNMTGTELLDLLSFHLDNILVEGLE